MEPAARILDKATLTLGDNRRVDFSRAIIFMTSNLGAAEMNAILRPKLGFAHGAPRRLDAQLAEQMSRAGVDAARRKFTPEFMNRLDAVVASIRWAMPNCAGFWTWSWTPSAARLCKPSTASRCLYRQR